MLYSRNWHNIVSQLYFNFLKKRKKKKQPKSCADTTMCLSWLALQVWLLFTHLMNKAELSHSIHCKSLPVMGMPCPAMTVTSGGSSCWVPRLCVPHRNNHRFPHLWAILCLLDPEAVLLMPRIFKVPFY